MAYNFSTCYAHKLEKHLKICNSRKDTSALYFLEGTNSKNSNDCDVNEVRSLMLSEVPPGQITELISKINKIYQGKKMSCMKHIFMLFYFDRENRR